MAKVKDALERAWRDREDRWAIRTFYRRARVAGLSAADARRYVRESVVLSSAGAMSGLVKR